MVLQIEEVDETGNLTATYVESFSDASSRVDIIVPENGINIWSRVLNVFLPAGYPHSVTSDYIQYQIYDSLQAFSSSIAGLLSSRAVLQGVGVGDASATPTAALLLSVLQDSMGRIATILFAHKLGTSLEPECKMYRLAADVFNDTAMILDCMSPALPKTSRVILLSFSSVLRALCGVAAGSSKASLSAHFAKWGNLGELNAGIEHVGRCNTTYCLHSDLRNACYLELSLTDSQKDSSQETIISLLGMLVGYPQLVQHLILNNIAQAGSIVVARISSPAATWTALILLLSVHLAMNHAAVRAVSMHSLNRQRANIVISNFLDQGKVLTPEEVSYQERIFEWDGALRWKGCSLSAKGRIGIPFRELLSSLAPSHRATSATKSPGLQASIMTQLYRKEEYVMWYSTSQRCAYIILKEGTSPSSQLKGWAHALWTVQRLHNSRLTKFEESQILSDLVSSTLENLSERWEDFLTKLKEKGWDVGIASLETASGTRICL